MANYLVKWTDRSGLKCTYDIEADTPEIAVWCVAILVEADEDDRFTGVEEIH